MLSEEFRSEYFTKLQTFLESEWDDPKAVVYPPVSHIFNAFEMTPYEKCSLHGASCLNTGEWL